MGCSQTKVEIGLAPNQGTVPKHRGAKDKKNKKNKNGVHEITEPGKPQATYAIFLSSHNAELTTETACALRGVTLMKNGHFVVADYKNNKLKLFSAKFEYLTDFELQSAPWDVCQAADKVDDILTTVPYKKEVHRFTVRIVNYCPRLVHVEEYKTEGFCWGITCFDGGIAVSVKVSVLDKTWPKPPEFQIHIHEYNGLFRRAIIYDTNGFSYFAEPKYLSVTFDDIFLLVSDYKQSRVLCINNEDDLIFSYAGIKSPNGIATDENKNLHIASFFGIQRVHKVGANGKYKDGLPHDQEKPLFPHGICYREMDRVIVLTTEQSLEVYKLV